MGLHLHLENSITPMKTREDQMDDELNGGCASNSVASTSLHWLIGILSPLCIHGTSEIHWKQVAFCFWFGNVVLPLEGSITSPADRQDLCVYTGRQRFISLQLHRMFLFLSDTDQMNVKVCAFECVWQLWETLGMQKSKRCLDVGVHPRGICKCKGTGRGQEAQTCRGTFDLAFCCSIVPCPPSWWLIVLHVNLDAAYLPSLLCIRVRFFAWTMLVLTVLGAVSPFVTEGGWGLSLANVFCFGGGGVVLYHFAVT